MNIDLAALIAALILSAVFALGGQRLLEQFWHHRKWISAAAGVSVSYVFVDVLPELAAQNEAIASSISNALYADQRIYFLALLSFVFFYGLEHLVLSQRGNARAEGKPSHDEADGVYWLHLGGFAAYCALIGYLLVERAERGDVALAVYVAAMAVHFIVVNHSLSEEHGAAYLRHGRWLLCASVLVGLGLGMLVTLSEVAFARMFAVLAGGVVITSLRAELPDDREGRFWPFCIGAVLFAVVLILA
ncbi:hypothetical protein QTH91_05995 [Variovorax dokdonensis]|uniref:ZIP Zinc transporter n=1 Tax=Variovorax dokdonensis TaxID=344883 RepID=A0ABT7N7V0_9BURK|nr:hypothetical protein [Variovorax dokdonensis]MDM0044026.1 hypothetical protein [Variovorax dokdonensis]